MYTLYGAYGQQHTILSRHHSMQTAADAYRRLSWYETFGAGDNGAWICAPDGSDVTQDCLELMEV